MKRPRRNPTTSHFGFIHQESDTVYSAPKLFFAYGLGNGMIFPYAAGATSILLADAPTPASIQSLTARHPPTVFFGVPTLYAMMLNGKQLPDISQLRLCVSAGEALPESIFSKWREATGLEILDGIGSTEMLHIFLSNTASEIRPGSSGKPVPGYEVEIRGEAGER